MIYILMLFIISEAILILFSLKISKCLHDYQYNKKYESHVNTKFLVIIPVHNEEIQILDAIDSIRKADYPQNFIDIILLNDRCTDKTIEIARSREVKIYSIDNKENTKGSLLKSFCSNYKEKICDYNYLCISDADTIFDEKFFIFAHNNFENGYKIVQGQICNIQYKRSTVSYFMTFFQQIINNFMFYQNKLERSVIICGKGVLISPDVLKQVKWDRKTLVEDIGFSFDALLKGYKIYYCHEMKVKTKHPYKFSDLWIQQRRWLSGQILIIKKYHSYMLDKRLIGVARIFLLIGYINMAVFCLATISLINPKIYLFIMISLYLWSFIINLIFIRYEIGKNIRYVFIFPFIFIFWKIIFIFSLFKPEKRWKPIKNKY